MGFEYHSWHGRGEEGGGGVNEPVFPRDLPAIAMVLNPGRKWRSKSLVWGVHTHLANPLHQHTRTSTSSSDTPRLPWVSPRRAWRENLVWEVPWQMCSRTERHIERERCLLEACIYPVDTTGRRYTGYIYAIKTTGGIEESIYLKVLW